MPTAKSQTLSIGLHVAFVALLLFLTSRSLHIPPPAIPLARNVRLSAPRRVLLNLAQQRSGGSNQTSLPAKHGAPPPTGHRTFIPPAQPENPKLPMPITVAFPSPTLQISAEDIGDPLSKLPHGALGLNGHNGIGESPACCGIGPGPGGAPSGIATGRPGHPVTQALLIYKVEPEFSEPARKAKYQGVVVLTIEVDTNGRERGIRVVQSPGLGLDEKAVEAVGKWRFKPGTQDGKPVVTTATVEVSFHLL